MDAVPVTLGQEFAGFAAQIRLGRERVRDTLGRVGQIPLGGTATGTGINTHAEFADRVRAKLAEATGIEISAPEDPFEAQGQPRRPGRALGRAQGRRRVDDQDRQRPRADGLGPRAGLAEIRLPELQKGSSIMPGKVNPVIPEVVIQVGDQVIGNDAAIAIAGTQGQFELNVRVPLIARNLLDSIKLLAAACTAARRAVRQRDRAQRGDAPAPRRVDPAGRDRAQPSHRLRHGDRDRQGGGELEPHGARGRERAGVDEEVLEEALDFIKMARPHG